MSFADFVLSEAAKVRLGVVMAMAPERVSLIARGLGRRLVKDSELHEDGRETEPHVTVFYGLKNDDVSAVRSVLAPFPYPEFRLGMLTKFDNADFDVLKFDVESPQLHRLNHVLKELPNESTYPDYKPHLTLAYVRKGSCDRLIGTPFPVPGWVRSTRIVYSDSEKRKHFVSMKPGA